jgi:predicted YcjX-like family ATPase
MAPSFQDIVEEARLSARALKDYGDQFFNPTVRLGVTGLSRAGKTVFITALIHGLTRGGRFPIFEPFATGRIARARLEPQPDDAVPRFAYETMSAPDRGAAAGRIRRSISANSGW